MRAYAAVVLAGGAGRRLGGAGKPELPVAGSPMLARVLAAVAGAEPRIVVGPPDLTLPPGVRRTRERPPGGGPVAAAAAGLALLPTGTREVALLAADLPFLSGPALLRLRRELASSGRDGAVYIDGAGRPQWLCGVWRVPALAAGLAGLPPDLTGQPLRALLAGLRYAEVLAPDTRPPPWWDCDTEDDLRRAEEWTDGGAG